MSDLISRQAAIDALVGLTDHKSVRELYEHVQENYLDGLWIGGISDAIDAIIALPSAERTKEDKEGKE